MFNVAVNSPQFGAIKTSTVKYQPQDQEVTVITRQTAQGGKKEEKQVKDIPFYLSFQFSATEAGDKVYQTVSGLTEKDILNQPVTAKLSLSPAGHLKLETEYSIPRKEIYTVEVPYQVADNYVEAGSQTYPYGPRVSQGYWEYSTEYRTESR